LRIACDYGAVHFIFHSSITGCLLYLTGKAKNGLWFSTPPAGALTDPPAVILDFMSAVPESQPALIQGHSRFYYSVLEN